MTLSHKPKKETRSRTIRAGLKVEGDSPGDLRSIVTEAIRRTYNGTEKHTMMLGNVVEWKRPDLRDIRAQSNYRRYVTPQVVLGLLDTIELLSRTPAPKKKVSR